MKTLSLALNVEGLTLVGEDKEKSPVELCTLVMKNMILAFGAQNRGLSEDDRRRYYKICGVFEKAVKENLDKVELEDDWFGFIKKCRREGLLMPSDLLKRVEDLVEEVKDR